MTIQQFCSVNNLSCCPYNPDWIHTSIVDIAFTDKNIFVKFTRIPVDTRAALYQFFSDNNYWAIDHPSGIRVWTKRYANPQQT